MRTLLCCLAILITAFHCFGQTGDIQMIKKFGGVKFESDGRNLKQKEVLAMMEPNPEAYQMFKKARTNYGVAGALGFAAGFLIGYPVGAGFAGGKPNWGLAVGGVGLFLTGIPFSSAGNQQAAEAIRIYNGKPAARNHTAIYFSCYGTRAKFSIKF